MDDELREVERQLRDNRPELSGLDLDAIKLRTMASKTRMSPPLLARKGAFMKSRVALVLVLALGVFMSGTGATLAVTGLAQSGSASSAQYPSQKEHHTTLGANESGSDESTPAVEPVVEEEAAQPVRQVASSSGGTLPFTGFLAIPVLIIGVGLLGAGVAMRMWNRNEDHA
jgi:hypothetical protein